MQKGLTKISPAGATVIATNISVFSVLLLMLGVLLEMIQV